MYQLVPLKKPEKIFEEFDRATELIQSALSSSYLDAFLENAENIVDNCTVRVENGVPDEQTVKKIEEIYDDINLGNQTSETIRRVIQLSFLKVTRKDAIQANHQMTPDTIGMMLSFLIEHVLKGHQDIKIFDPVVGTGNLLTAIINRLKQQTDVDIHAYGIDNDESMLAVASVSTELQKLPVDLYHQDSVSSLDIPQCELAIADLPVGYYPLDDNTKNYKTRAKRGHSFVHHLLIEQTMNYLVSGGYGFFIVPNNFFKTQGTQGFVQWIQSVGFLQGFINLPEDMFENQQVGKSILMLQKHGGSAQQAKQVLLGSFPPLKDQQAFKKFVGEINDWFAKNLKRGSN